MKIKSTKARVVLNSRGDPTLEIEVNGIWESVPSGASKGSKEAPYIPPAKAALLYNKDLVDFIKTFDIQSLDDIKTLEDEFFRLGGFEKYGANTLLALEYAILRAWSKYTGAEIYEFFTKSPKIKFRLLSNIIGGGAHALWKGPDIQEFLVSPKTKTITEAIFVNSIFHKIIGEKLSYLDTFFLGSKNDEGAWVSTLTIEKILSIMKETSEELELSDNIRFDIGIDVAATQLYNPKTNRYEYRRDAKFLTKEGQIDFILELKDLYHLFYIEDPLHENDFEGFSEIKKKSKSLIVGDDLTVTNPEYIKKAIKMNSINGVIIKPNQVGSLIKTIDAIELAKSNNLTVILSHRSGETESSILSHLAVGFDVDMVKFGIVNGERIAKLNELIRIEEKLS